MPTATIQAENRRATLLMVLSMAAFAAEDLFVKLAAAAMPPGEILVINGLIGGVLMWVMAARQGERVWSWRALQGAALVRNVAEAIAAFAYILALAVVPLAFASAVLQATPLMVTAGAALFLGETVGWRRWSSIVVGFIGVLVILQPWDEGVDLAGVMMVVCVIFLALRDLVTRLMPKDLGTLSVSAWGFFSFVPAGLLLMWVQGTPFIWPNGEMWAQLGGAVVFSLVGYYTVVEAMRVGEVSSVAPFRYTRLVFAVFLAVVFLGETVTLHVVIGSALVIASGLYVFARTRNRTVARALAKGQK